MASHRGSALLSALFIMTLTAIAATMITVSLRHYLAEVQLMVGTDQFREKAVIARFWSIQALLSEKYEKLGRIQGKTRIKVRDLPLSNDPNIRYTIELVDLSSKFNLNQLSNPLMKTAFYRLLKHLLEEDSGKSAYQITHLLSEWVRAYRPGHSENNTRVFAHTSMTSLSELLFIPEITPEIQEKILPYITILPAQSKLNINTMSEDLLMSLGQGKNAIEHVTNIINAREREKGILSLSMVQADLRALGINPSLLTTESEYFLSTAVVSSKTQRVTLYTLLKRVKTRVDNKDVYTIYVIQETWHSY